MTVEAMVDIDEIQNRAHAEALRRWPELTVMSEVLALVEEVGEIARAVVKRQEKTRGTPEEWTANLRVEIGQAMLVLLNIGATEGIWASALLIEAMEAFEAKPDREGMNLHG